ncbi:MAG TPA: rhomboid family intramembrane serine protease [Chloroflexi bacterium]|nr:rhomboid family intramembrane serine protease [Chloroflexota bacterium]
MNTESDSDVPWSSTPPAPRWVRLSIPHAQPLWTYVILGLNVTVFAVSLLVGQDLAFALGAKINQAIVAGQLWRLGTALFLHAGLLHLGFNSYALWIFGPQVEMPYGRFRFLLIYFFSGLAASAVSFALTPAVSVGASGAIFGLVGAILAYIYRYRDRLLAGRRRLANLIGIVAYNILYGFVSPWVDNAAHIGGLLAGLALGWFLAPRYEIVHADPTRPPRLVDRSSLSQWAVGIGLVGLGVGWALLFGFARWGR